MLADESETFVLKFKEDTLNSVGIDTANKLVLRMGSESLDSLIHLLLRNLAAETDVLPTSKLIGYPLKANWHPL